MFGDDLKKILPIIREGGSDTAMFDNVLEFLVMAGRSLPHAILMMIPEPWSGHESMSPERKAFYEYHSSLMEPWDGPASIAFTDGTVIGAVLDRNGLRPSRYYVTKDDLVIMASEVGVLDIPPENILVKERLHPGRIFLVDTARGRIVDDEEIKRELAARASVRGVAERSTWSTSRICRRRRCRAAGPRDGLPAAAGLRLHRTRTCGCSWRRWPLNGEEPIGSMGTDTSLAVLSDRPRLLYDYFKQLFAQVTNPPLDAIREELVTSMESTIGPEGNLLEPEPESCRQINDPVPDPRQRPGGQAAAHLPPGSRVPVDDAADAVRRGRGRAGPGARHGGRCCERASRRGRRRPQHPDPLRPRHGRAARAPIPSLLATAGVHHHLVREGTRTRCGAGRRIGRRARSAPRVRCCSATAPARSIRIWPSRRSTT